MLNSRMLQTRVSCGRMLYGYMFDGADDGRGLGCALPVWIPSALSYIVPINIDIADKQVLHRRIGSRIWVEARGKLLVR